MKSITLVLGFAFSLTAQVTAIPGAAGNPSGAAGGALAGTYPNPTIANIVSGTIPYSASNGVLTSSTDRLAIDVNAAYTDLYIHDPTTNGSLELYVDNSGGGFYGLGYAATDVVAFNGTTAITTFGNNGGMLRFDASGNLTFRNSANANKIVGFPIGGNIESISSGVVQWSNSTTDATTTKDTGIARNAAGILEVNNGTPGTLRDLTLRNHTATGYRTTTNCSDSAGDAACSAAAAGSVVIDATDTTTVVSTTAVTADSQIIVIFDSSLGTRLGVTCNTTAALPTISARSAGTSFTLTTAVAPVTNPACYSFMVIN